MVKSSAMLKAQGYKAPTVPDPFTEENQATIHLITEACNSLYLQHQAISKRMSWPSVRPVSLLEIYYMVKAKVLALRLLSASMAPDHRQNLWPYPERSKRYIDRMVNFCAAPSTFPDGIPDLVCVQPGQYRPNTERIKGEVKDLPTVEA